MPKKLSTNPKALEARVRKVEKKKAEAEKVEKLKEDAYWRDDDKHATRKMQRKEERDKKKMKQKERKAAVKAAYDQEMEILKPSRNQTQPTKITRSQIEANLTAQKAKQEKEQKKAKLAEEIPIEENVNRLKVDGLEARGVEEAIKILSLSEPKGDRHPEKRMKAAFIDYEERNLPRLKAENPNLRISQLQQILYKNWFKSPDNPLNKSITAYNAKT